MKTETLDKLGLTYAAVRIDGAKFHACVTEDGNVAARFLQGHGPWQQAMKAARHIVNAGLIKGYWQLRTVDAPPVKRTGRRMSYSMIELSGDSGKPPLYMDMLYRAA